MTSANQPIGHVIDACATELAELTVACESLQSALSEALEAGLGDAQLLDLITQRTAGLAQFLMALGRAAPADWRVDAQAAARVLTLSAQARALTGQSRYDADSGDLDLFGT
jgi:hypothetical protein